VGEGMREEREVLKSTHIVYMLGRGCQFENFENENSGEKIDIIRRHVGGRVGILKG
jgi:hypothetical protein